MVIRWSEKDSRRLIGLLATQIRNPILKLKFLRRFAPAQREKPARFSWRPALHVTCSVLLAMAGSYLLIRATARQPAPEAYVAAVIPAATAHCADCVQAVWQVEQTADSETWSNGLRIDNRFRTAGPPRSYAAFRVDEPRDHSGVHRSDPAGIVFHTTESQQAPFEARESGALRRISESLLSYVQRRRAYNFLIDRFGRVYRIVAEAEVAGHAGYSVWSDEKWLYLNLNESFLGVSFEARTEPGQTENAATPAQVRAAAILIEMLRSRYGIPAANCVTHGQVSVNPANMRVGYHTDWASAFPFFEAGLPDNYARPLPGLWALGFEHDATFLQAAGSRMAVGVELADRMISSRAAKLGMSVAEYRKMLRGRYREYAGAVRLEIEQAE